MRRFKLTSEDGHEVMSTETGLDIALLTLLDEGDGKKVVVTVEEVEE